MFLSTTVLDEAFKPILFGLDLGALLVLGCFAVYAFLTLLIYWKAHEKGKRCGVYEGFSAGYQAALTPAADESSKKTVRKRKTRKKEVPKTEEAPKRRGRPPGSKNKKKAVSSKTSTRKYPKR